MFRLQIPLCQSRPQKTHAQTSAPGTRTPVEFADIVTVYLCLAHFVLPVDTQNNRTRGCGVTKFSTHCLTDTFCLFSLFVCNTRT